MKHLGLPPDPNKYKYVRGDGYGEVYGYHWDTQVIILDGYEQNKNYDLELMDFIGRRFTNIAFLSEGEIFNG